MNGFELDFQRGPRPSGWGWLLLVVGGAALAGAVQVHHLVQQEAQSQARRLARAQATAPLPSAADAAEDPAVVAARRALELARLPWDTLFAALEATDRTDVALLSVAPETARRRLRIEAEARDLGAMLGFQRELQRSAALRDVVLVDHTMTKDGAEMPVRFALVANWGGTHAAP